MVRRIVFLLFLLGSAIAYSQMMSQQAQIASQQPAKLDIAPVNVQNNAGQTVPVQIKLLDGEGKPTHARRTVNAEIQVKQPSGQTTTTQVTLAPGESTKEVDLTISETGVSEVSVGQPEKRLIGGTKYVLVNPSHVVSHAKKSRRHKSVPKSPGPSAREFDFRLPRSGKPRLILATYAFQIGETFSGSSPQETQSQLMLRVSGEDAGGGIRADGKTCANIQVFYMGADELHRDVQVWLKWSNGAMTPNPLVFHKGAREADACWTSQYPFSAATVQIVGTNPHLPFAASETGTVRFSENIQGVGFANPPMTITLVDNVNLTAMFYDPIGHPVKLLGSRNLFFDSNNPVIHLAPQRATVTAGSFDSSTLLVPTFFGKSTIEVFTDGYPKATHEIKVTWLGVLLCCLLGGLLGGYLAFINSAGKLWARIATGLIVGLVASWAYVFVGLPKVETSIVHNELSVLFVALVAGFTGVKAVSTISKKLNFGF